MRFPAPKRSRARTGKEFLIRLDYYDFTVVTIINKPDPFILSIEHFRFTISESSKLHEFMTHATSYSLLKYSIGEEQQLTSKFIINCNQCVKAGGRIVQYVQVLDEVAESKDTILHDISELQC